MPHHSHIALVLLGGDAVAPDALDALTVAPDLVVAADSGVDQAHRLGRRIDVAVGDFDSVSVEGLARAVADGTEIRRHPMAKAETDMVLALGVVAERGIRRVWIVGGDGGRLDHLLANALVMGSPDFADLEISALGARGARLHVVRATSELTGAAGEYVSLLPLHGDVEGVRTDGLRFALHDELLVAGSSRGVSNELLGTQASVSVRAGVLLVVLPGPSHRPDPHTSVPRASTHSSTTEGSP